MIFARFTTFCRNFAEKIKAIQTKCHLELTEHNTFLTAREGTEIYH
jgi:hypothetical protein